MAKYADRNKNVSGDIAPKTIDVTDDQSYEYRRDRGFVTVKYYFHGQPWQSWTELMAKKEMKGAQMSFFIGAKYDQSKSLMMMRGDFAYTVWVEKYARRFDAIKFVLASTRGVKLNIPADDDELKYYVNGMDLGDIIRESDQRQAMLDAERTMRELAA